MNFPEVFYSTNVVVLFSDNTRKVFEVEPRASMKGVKQFINDNAEKPSEVSEATVYHAIKRNGEINVDCNDEIFSKYASKFSDVDDVALQIGTSL